MIIPACEVVRNFEYVRDVYKDLYNAFEEYVNEQIEKLMKDAESSFIVSYDECCMSSFIRILKDKGISDKGLDLVQRVIKMELEQAGYRVVEGYEPGLRGYGYLRVTIDDLVYDDDCKKVVYIR